MRRGPWILIAVAVVGLCADAVRLSATRLYPRYDEVSYLALARDVAREGGVAGTIRCYLEARCLEDNRPPLYQFLLEPLADDSPRFFADAKLVSLGTVLLLLVVVLVVLRRTFSPAVAAGSVITLALMPIFSDYGARVLHDPLYAVVTFAAVAAMAAWQERGFVAWLAVGGLVGLAFLTKGSGHLLLVPLLVVSLYRHRTALWRRPIVYAAACGFVAVAFFLLWRNHEVWGSAFYNSNGRQVWIDRWRDVWALQLSPEWKKIGLGWYLSRHSIWRLLYELARSAAVLVGYFVYTAGVGPASHVARVVTGAAVILLAAQGVRRRWRAGARVEVVAVLATIGLFFLGLTLAARGGPGAQPRYVLPYVVLLVPYAVYETLERLWPPVRARLAAARWARPGPALTALALLAVVLVGRLAFVAPGALINPRGSYAVEPRWHETSAWLSRSLAPGERFALDYRSYFSTWDLPRPDTDPRWNFWLGMPTDKLMPFLDGSHIRKALIDTTAAGTDELADRLSAARDGHGPLAFLGWPRCFADGDRPSRFLVFCR